MKILPNLIKDQKDESLVRTDHYNHLMTLTSQFSKQKALICGKRTDKKPQQSHPFTASINQINPMIDRIMEDESVESVILINDQGEPILTNISVVNATNFGRKINPLGHVVRSAVKEMNVLDDAMVLRINTKKFEIMMVPQEDFSIIVVQHARLRSRRKMTKKMLETKYVN